MKLGNKKIFLNKPLLYQMINLRKAGLAFTTLSTLFNCDRSSLAYQCDKFFVEPQEDVYTFERIISQIIPKAPAPTYKIVNGERINLGKSYKEYISS